MEDNKYYTPSIPELHVGFEYEQLNHMNEWIPMKIKGLYWIIDNLFIKERVRVKYLDREDIESFGFVIDKNASIDDRQNFEMHGKSFGTYGITKYEKVKSIIYRYDGSKEYTLFDGIIKNKSELKRLLSQLQIID